MARILIIDDNRDIRLALRKLLELEGHEAKEAINGKEGALVYSTEPVDLVITDLLMPERDGVEVLLDLRKSHPDIKAIVISGEGQDFLSAVEDFGALRTVSKPFNATEVIQTIRQVLSE